MLVAEKFMSDLIKAHGNHPVSTDGGSKWYPMACQFLKLKHHTHSPLEKSLIERKMQYIKDITKESFEDYFPVEKRIANSTQPCTEMVKPLLIIIIRRRIVLKLTAPYCTAILDMKIMTKKIRI